MNSLLGRGTEVALPVRLLGPHSFSSPVNAGVGMEKDRV